MTDYKDAWSQFFDEGMAAGMGEEEANQYADRKLEEWYSNRVDAVELQFEDR